jgi:hypothetical protein
MINLGLYYEQSNHGAESGSQINVIKRMDSHKKTAIGQLQMKGGQTCGIYDPNRFKQPSSAPFGFVSDYDPYWRLQKSAAQEDNGEFFNFVNKFVMKLLMFRWIPVDCFDFVVGPCFVDCMCGGYVDY